VRIGREKGLLAVRGLEKEGSISEKEQSKGTGKPRKEKGRIVWERPVISAGRGLDSTGDFTEWKRVLL